jgi:hypothetical protein
MVNFAPAKRYRADRIREHHLTLCARSPRLGLDEQDRRGLSLSLVWRSAEALADAVGADAMIGAVHCLLYRDLYYRVFRRERALALAKLAVEEGRCGNVPDKITKIALRVLGTLADLVSVKTCGIVEEDPAVLRCSVSESLHHSLSSLGLRFVFC